MMKISKIPGLGRFGQFIDDLDFATLSDEEWLNIGRSHLKNLVTIIRNPKNMDKNFYLDKVRKFGPFKSVQKSFWMKKYGCVFDATKPETWVHLPLDKDDRLYLESTSNMLEKTEDGSYLKRVTGIKDKDGRVTGFFSTGYVNWHSNESSFITFSPEVSLIGGQYMKESATGFCQTVDYYESVSESFRSELDEMVILHRYTPGNINESEKTDPLNQIQVRLGFVPNDDAEVPLVVTSPGGTRGLHYPVNSVYSIKGMSKKQSDKIFSEINQHIFSDSNIYDYYWENDNDWLLFDNSVTLHRRIGGHPQRVGYRVQYDPSALLDKPWEPWHQPEFRERYHTEIEELVSLLNIKDFKLPTDQSYVAQE
jgi:alpha-ketoglutarate-dependent taurine dioxygenase